MQRVVLKVGSAVLTEANSLSEVRLKNLIDFIAELKKFYDVILISSGAVAAGYTSLKLDKNIISNKQALASIGQPLLMKHYKKEFSKYHIICAQMLLTADDFDSRKRTEFAKNAIDVLLNNGVLPIINENDVTATEELLFGDNDRLAAHTTYYFDAELLVILTDIDGYYDDNPKVNKNAKLLKNISFIKKEELQANHTPNNEFATGGIVTKLMAADFLLKHNKKMFLSSGFDLSFARDFLLKQNHTRGTLFSPKQSNV